MPRRKQLKPIPSFKSEAEERAFWESHDTSGFVDWSKGHLGFFPNQSSRAIPQTNSFV